MIISILVGEEVGYIAFSGEIVQQSCNVVLTRPVIIDQAKFHAVVVVESMIRLDNASSSFTKIRKARKKRGWALQATHPSDEERIARARIAGVFPDGVGAKPRGIGIEFLNLVSTDKETIAALLQSGRRHHRTPVQLPIEVTAGSRTVQLTTLNLSRGGAFVADENVSFQPGDQVMFKIELHQGDDIEGFAEVAWAPEEERAARPAGFALQFQKMSRDDVQRLNDRLADFGARE